MNYYLLTFLVLVLPYATISIYQDIRNRKINNLTNLSFLYISLAIFSFFLVFYDIFDYLILFLSSFLSFYIYKKHFWGGADGKIFIGLVLLILALGNKYFYFHFILNILILYSLTILVLIVLRTSLNDKINVIKKVHYGQVLFQLLIIYIIVKLFLFKLVSVNSVYFVYFMILIILLIIFSNKYIKKFYSKIKNIKLRVIMNFILFLVLIILISYSKEYFILKYFAFIFLFRIFLEFTSQVTEKIKTKDEKYHSPFSIYLFAAAIFTMIVKSNIIEIIIKFI